MYVQIWLYEICICPKDYKQTQIEFLPYDKTSGREVQTGEGGGDFYIFGI